ncbi:hypothetical protein ACNF40_08495 [Cuniculiplasma sp. SKW4]|uniref:hypothetical protein n=1 Tax=Cuniculiplasma sp. SKW4 TaxID=3400171 RepID=UPI003FD2DB19
MPFKDKEKWMKEINQVGDLTLEEPFGDVLQVSLEIQLDEIDKAILKIFHKYPGRSYKVSQILSILSYQGIRINYGQLARRLGFFVDMTIIMKEKRTNVFSYRLSK